MNPEPLYDDLWDYSKPQETEACFRDLLPQVEKSNDKSAHLQLLTQIARTQSLQRKFKEAHEILDQVELVIDDLDIVRIRYLLERGRTFNSARIKEKAYPLFVAAYELSIANCEDFYAIDAAHMLGIAAPEDKQLDWNLKAVELAENTSHSRARQWLGALYNNIGWTYHETGDFQKALQMFEKALHWRECEAKPRKEVPVRIAKWAVARACRSLGRVEDALKLQQALLAEWETVGEQDGYVYEELGECLLALNRNNDATLYFGKAFELLSQDVGLQTSEKPRLERMKELGDSSSAS